MDASPDQAEATRLIAEWLRSGGREFRLGGLAGTGKTSLTMSLQLPFDTVFCAPTGKAASVMTRKLSEAGRPGRAQTIHSLLYVPREHHADGCPRYGISRDPDGSMLDRRCAEAEECGVGWDRREAEEAPALIVVDESSMVNGTMYRDLVAIGSPVLFVGDYGQLKPVGDNFSVMESRDYDLTEIHRQKGGRGDIVDLAHRVRNGERPTPGPQRTDITAETMVLCYTNKTRMALNVAIRKRLGFGAAPMVGDKVICLRNNARAGVFNGQTGRIHGLEPKGKFRYRATIAIDDGPLYKGIISREQFGSAATLDPDHGEDLFAYGYAITVHKAQGSEADDVVLYTEWNRMPEEEYSRWLYTGVTRAKERLTVTRATGRRRG